MSIGRLVCPNLPRRVSIALDRQSLFGHKFCLALEEITRRCGSARSTSAAQEFSGFKTFGVLTMASAKKATQAPWRVGVLFSQTGCTAETERTQLCGTLLAIEEINEAGGVLGREIQPVIYDPGASDLLYAMFAKKMLTEDAVSSIFGCYTSASRKTVLPIVERFNGLLWYPTTYEGFEFSPNIIYTGAAPNQNCLELCRYLMKSHGPRFYLVGSDYIYPRRTNQLIRDHVAGHGGTIVSERYLDIRASRRDFLPVIADVKRSGGDVIFSTVVGEGTSHLYQAFADAGLDPKTMPIASITTTEAEIGAMGPAVGEAHITAASYFEGISTAASKAFVALHRKKFGDSRRTNVCAETAYFQVRLFAQALAQSGSAATDDLRPFVLGSSFDAPQGRITINPASGHADLWTRIGRANKAGQFDLVWESKAPIESDPFLICS